MKSIAIYNDRVRRSLIDPEEKSKLEEEGCLYVVMMTSNLSHTIQDKIGLAIAISQFNTFNENNDPYEEHDFLKFEFEGESIIVKFREFNS